MSVFLIKYRLHDKNKDKTDAILKTSCNAHNSNKKTILSFFLTILFKAEFYEEI